MNTDGNGADESPAIPGQLGSGVPFGTPPPGTTVKWKPVIPAGIAGIQVPGKVSRYLRRTSTREKLRITRILADWFARFV